MMTFLMSLHIMVCLLLILVVLLQRGKGSDIGAALGGGGGNTVFGSRGAGNFLTKLTSGCAVIFMLTSLSLSYLGTQETQVTIFDDEVEDLRLDDALQEIDGEADSADPAVSDALEEIPASADALEEVVPFEVPADGSTLAPVLAEEPETP